MKEQKQQHQTNQLELPPKITCLYSSEISAYIGSIIIANTSQSQIYFHIVSSFCMQLSFLSPPINSIKPNQTVTMQFRIKSTNQISRSDEFLGISYSSLPVNSLCSITCSIRERVWLEFDIDIVQDQSIEQILQQESNNLIKSAAEFSKSPQDIAESERLYEEAFLIYRKNYKPILQLSLIKLKQNHPLQALSYTELYSFQAETSDQFNECAYIKVKILQACLKQIETETLKIELRRQMYILVEGLLQNNQISRSQKQEIQQLKDNLVQEKEYINSSRRQKRWINLIKNAIIKFPLEKKLLEYFQSKDKFQDYLKGAFNQCQRPDETPQYALDPINYEIFKHPVITPTGTSYQKEFIEKFLASHGSKDPHTRAYLHPNSVIPNSTLQVLIQSHPKLDKWIEYEHQSTRY